MSLHGPWPWASGFGWCGFVYAWAWSAAESLGRIAAWMKRRSLRGAGHLETPSAPVACTYRHSK
eukprot:10359375-Karenia_brevis.AAC.1